MGSLALRVGGRAWRWGLLPDPLLDLGDDGLEVGDPDLFQLFHESLEAGMVAKRVEIAIVLDPLPVLSGLDSFL